MCVIELYIGLLFIWSTCNEGLGIWKFFTVCFVMKCEALRLGWFDFSCGFCVSKCKSEFLSLGSVQIWQQIIYVCIVIPFLFLRLLSESTFYVKYPLGNEFVQERCMNSEWYHIQSDERVFNIARGASYRDNCC